MSRKKTAPAPAPSGPAVTPSELRRDTLRVVPLGGVGEFGKNMMALEYGDDMIVVDCGQMFPEADMPGVDSVIPDFAYIDERADKLRGVVLTHGHEDHIGAIQYFLRDFDYPVYGSRLTLALVRSKLREMEIEDECELHEIKGRDRIRLGAFEIEFLGVTHSIPDTMALAITTPVGTIIHTGDYKFDTQDPDETSDFYEFARLGESGVLAVFGDSTNVDREGTSPSERSVAAALRPLVAAAEGSVILSTFSSGLHRLQTMLDVAKETGRKVAVLGRSLERNFEIATGFGMLHYTDDLVIHFKDLMRLPARERLLVCTGCQGEPLAALSRLALDDLRGYRIEEGDTVIFSARMIPGNEKAIFRTINHLCRRGAHVLTEKDAPGIHASGHAYREEIRQLYRMLRPKYVVPVHGEIRQQMGHRDLAASIGIPADRVFILDNGDALDFRADGSARAWRGAGLAGRVLVDGKVIDQVEDVVLRDRMHLAEDGMVTVILVIDPRLGEIAAGPDIVTRGFIEVDGNADLIEECKQVVRDTFAECPRESREEWDVVKSAIRKALRRFLKEETDRYPLILPVVMEV